MTYLDVHILFMALPTVIFARHWRRRAGTHWHTGLTAIGVLAVLATLWTTPWDNLMVAWGVWSYPPDAVLAVLLHIPIEEQAFFIIQPLFTGCWLLMIQPDGPPPAHPTRRALSWRVGGALAALTLGAVAAWTVTLGPQWLYLGSFVAWFSLPVAIQLGVGADRLWAWRHTWAIGVLPATLYLCVLDKRAIEAGVWAISDEHTLGLHVAGLPIEEILFFLITNVLVVQGILLYQSIFGGSHERAALTQPSAG